MSSSHQSTGDPPGGFFSQPRLLRTPFGRMLQHLNIRPNTPSVDEPSEPYEVVPSADPILVSASDLIGPPSDPPSSTYHSHPRVTKSVVVPVQQTSTQTTDRHRPDPDASFSSEDPLSAYSPYTREVILRGGDQSVYEDSISFADTIEAAEEAMDYYGNLSSETLLPGVSPVPSGVSPVPSEIATPRRHPTVARPVPPTPPTPSGPSPPPTMTLAPSEVYVQYQSTSSSVLAGAIVKADYHGVAHPYLRGYIGPDRSTQQSRKHFYVLVRQGWNPGIYTSWSDAWVRIADFRSLTSQAPDFAGASTYTAAVRYLGWDPRSVPPRGPFPPAATVPYTQGPWPRPPPSVSPVPTTPSSVASSLASRLESALAAQSVPPATISHVVTDLHQDLGRPAPIPSVSAALGVLLRLRHPRPRRSRLPKHRVENSVGNKRVSPNSQRQP